MSGAVFEVRNAQADGAPVALVHGFLGAPTMWDPVLAQLARRVAAESEGRPGPLALATLPGHGASPWVPPGDFVAAVDALAAALPEAPAQWLLVGYSMGARLALALALRHSARVRGAVLVGGDPGLERDDERAARRAWDEAQAARVRDEGLAAFVAQWEALPLFATQAAALSDAARAAQRAAREGHTAEGIAWAMRTLGLGSMPPMWSALARCALPLRVVTGALDAKFTAIGARIARTAPAAAHRVAPGAGHNVALEAPAVVSAEIVAALAPASRRVRAMEKNSHDRGIDGQ